MQPQEGVVESKNSAADAHNTDEATEMLRYLVQNSVTKEDVTQIIKETVPPIVTEQLAKSEQRLRDYVDKRVTAAEQKFINPLRKEDEKVDEIVDSAEQRKLFERTEATRLKNLGPFPKLVKA